MKCKLEDFETVRGGYSLWVIKRKNGRLVPNRMTGFFTTKKEADRHLKLVIQEGTDDGDAASSN